MQERKRFKIPRQIDSSVHIWRFVKLSDLVVLSIPLAISILLFYWVIYAFPLKWRLTISALPTVFVAALIFIKPIRDRNNITLFDLLRYRVQFNQRQKIYYFKKSEYR